MKNILKSAQFLERKEILCSNAVDINSEQIHPCSKMALLRNISKSRRNGGLSEMPLLSLKLLSAAPSDSYMQGINYCTFWITYKESPFVVTVQIGGVMPTYIGSLGCLEGKPQHLAELQHLLVLFTYNQRNKTCICLLQRLKISWVTRGLVYIPLFEKRYLPSHSGRGSQMCCLHLFNSKKWERKELEQNL